LALALARAFVALVVIDLVGHDPPVPARHGSRGCYNSDMQQALDGTQISELKAVVELALGEAKRRGASQCDVGASMNRGLSTTVRLGEVDTVEYQRDRGVSVTVYFGKRKGSASTADLSAKAVRETVEKACTIATYTAEDNCSGLADPEELARDIPDLDLHHPWDVSPDAAVELARACEAAGLAVDARITNSEGASVNTQRDVRVYGNSHGFVEGYASTSHSLSCVLLAEEGEDMQRDYWFSTARDSKDLQAFEIIGRKAGERALARLGGRRISTRKSPAVCSGTSSPRCVAALNTASRRSCSVRRASRCCRRSCTSKRSRICARRWRAVRSMTKASRRGIAGWCATAFCRATCWAATPRASSGSRRRATRAAFIISSSPPPGRRSASTRCSRRWAPVSS